MSRSILVNSVMLLIRRRQYQLVIARLKVVVSIIGVIGRCYFPEFCMRPSETLNDYSGKETSRFIGFIYRELVYSLKLKRVVTT